MSAFGVRKSVVIEEAPAKKMGDLILTSIFKKYRVQPSFMSREGKMRQGDFGKTQEASRIPLMISVSTCKTKQKLLA